MSKKKNSAAAKVAALSPEEFQKLTPEAQLEYMKGLQDANTELSTKAADLEGQNKKLKSSVKKAGLDISYPSFGVEADAKNGIEGGTYEFTCPTFTWDDNSVIDVEELAKGLESKDLKTAEKAAKIVAELVKRNSGIIRRKED